MNREKLIEALEEEIELLKDKNKPLKKESLDLDNLANYREYVDKLNRKKEYCQRELDIGSLTEAVEVIKRLKIEVGEEQ